MHINFNITMIHNKNVPNIETMNSNMFRHFYKLENI